MTCPSNTPRIMRPTDPERYRNLPEQEQRRLLEKKCRELEARGLPVMPSSRPTPGDGLRPWQVLPLLDAILRCPCCLARASALSPHAGNGHE